MKSFVFVLLITVMAVACSRDKQNQSANDRTSTNVAADNSGRNARDRIAAKATQIAGVKQVDNQLEVTN